MKTNYFRVASNQWFTFSIITRKPPGLRNGRAKGCAVVPPNAIIYNFGVRASNLEFRTRFEFLEETSNVISRAQKLAGMWSAEREIRDLRRVRILRRVGRTCCELMLHGRENFQSFEIINYEFQFLPFNLRISRHCC